MTLRLLAADDNAAMLKMIRLAFAGEDAVVEVVSRGDIAIDMLNGFRPDVVLADVSMPGYNGYEVCELIRHDKEFASVPVILLNGAFDSLDTEEAARVRASGYLTKPFDPSEMIALVERLVRENAEIPESDKKYDTTDHFPKIPPHIRESYFGPNRILEIFNGETFSDEIVANGRLLSEELVNRAAERAAKKLFPDIETYIRKALAARE